MGLHCEVCGAFNRSRKDRFCAKHESEKLREMEEAGYLTPVPAPTRRSQDQETEANEGDEQFEYRRDS